MRALRIYKYGHSDEIKTDDVPAPVPGENQVLVEVHAVGVNPIDWKIREGLYNGKMPIEFPHILGQDFAGRVIGMGSGVHGYQNGDLVFGFASGAYAEYVSVDESKIAKIPEDIDYVTAASIPTAGLTAYQLIMKAIDLKEGQDVLIHGAGGGVGTFAVQLGIWKKAKITTTASSADIDYLHKLGIENVIDYESEKFEDKVGDFDVVIDLVGGETLQKSYTFVKKGGVILSTLGQVDMKLTQEKGIKGINFMIQQNSEDLSHLARMLDQKIIKPRINEVLPLSEASRAQDDLEKSHSKGKIVLEVRPS